MGYFPSSYVWLFFFSVFNGCSASEPNALCDAIVQKDVKKANRFFKAYQYSKEQHANLDSLLNGVPCLKEITPDDNPLLSEPPQFKYELVIQRYPYTIHFYHKNALWQIALIQKNE